MRNLCRARSGYARRLQVDPGVQERLVSVTLDHLLEPISLWLDDQAVEEVCIDAPREVWVYSRGAFPRHDVPNLDVDWIEDIAIVAAAQRRQDIGHRRPLLATDLVGRGRLQAV